MPETEKTKISLLTRLTNVVFAKRNAERAAQAQQELWQLCAYGVPAKTPGDTPLLERIVKQLERGAKMDVQYRDGDTPLVMLARRARSEEALCLIERGANINITNDKGETAFLAAAAAGDGAVIGKLLEKGAYQLETDANGRNALYLMVHANADFKDAQAKADQARGLSMLMVRGLQLDDSLKMAIYSNRPHLVNCVPELAPVYALAIAAAKGNAADVELMIDLGVKPDSPTRYKDNTPLCAVTFSGNVDIMETLLKAGADINLKSPTTHRTPVETAARHGQCDAFNLLLDAGAIITPDMKLLELAHESRKPNIMGTVYDALVARGIMKTEVVTGKVAMKPLKLKTPAAGAA